MKDIEEFLGHLQTKPSLDDQTVVLAAAWRSLLGHRRLEEADQIAKKLKEHCAGKGFTPTFYKKKRVVKFRRSREVAA